MDTSPAQRLMNHRTKTLLPTTQAQLQPRVVYPEREKKKIIQRQKQQAKYFDRTAKDLPELEGDTVRMKPFRMGQKTWRKAKVTSRLDSRSYTVETPEGDTYSRNRCHLKKSSEKPTQQMSATGGNVCEDPERSVPDHTTMEPQTSIPDSSPGQAVTKSSNRRTICPSVAQPADSDSKAPTSKEAPRRTKGLCHQIN